MGAVLRFVRSFALTPLILSGLGMVVVLAVTVVDRAELGVAGVAWLSVAMAFIFGGALLFRMRLRGERAELDRVRAELAEERGQLEVWRKSLDDDAAGFEKRRQGFEKRLMTYHEWMEFPNLDSWADIGRVPEGMDERDRLVLGKVQEAADRILEGFRTDRFSENGKFEPRLLLSDLADLVQDVARIYQPHAVEPLLETSLEKILKAANHISLQLLFHLEQIPFNLKDFSLARAYEHFRTASRLHAAYKSVSPYLPYANYTWQLGRIVFGANPLVTGTWILGSELIRRTGAKLSKVYVDRYTLKLTGETVRVIANEAAMIFDEDFRYRDASWIYGLELVEMVRFFPLSRETLQEALCEIGNLPLRNSYDRVFLYRCLALGRSPQPQVFVRSSVLSIEQRREIAERLERFFRHHLHGRRSDRVAEWSAGAGERLGLSLQVGLTRSTAEESGETVADAVASLASFLFAVKELPPDKVQALLSTIQTAGWLAEPERQTVIQALVAEPAMFFDYPNLDPENPLVPVYFGDLVDLETRERPPDLQGLWAIREAALYFRLDRKAFEPGLFQGYAKHFKDRLLPTSPEQAFGMDLVIGLIRTLNAGETPLFIYPRAGVEEADGVLGIRLPAKNPGRPSRWLVGTPSRLYVLEVNETLEPDDFHRHRIVWNLSAERCASGAVVLDRCRGLVKSGCVIRGGTWTGEGIDNNRADMLGLSIPDCAKRHEAYYAPLREWLRRAGASA